MTGRLMSTSVPPLFAHTPAACDQSFQGYEEVRHVCLCSAQAQWSSPEMRSLLDHLDSLRREPLLESRDGVRSGCRGVAMFVTLEDNGAADTSHLVPMRNISRSGVCFLDRRSVPDGTLCRVNIRLEQSAWLKRKGHVVRSRAVSPEAFELGVVFDQSLSEAELAQIAKDEPPPGCEKSMQPGNEDGR